MKIQKSEISRKIKAVKPSMNRMQQILIADGLMTAADAENTNTAITVPIDTEERFVLPQKAIAMIEKLPECVIDITEKGGKVVIKTPNGTSRFATVPPEDFQNVSAKIKKIVSSISFSDFSEAVNAVLYAADEKAEKDILQGISFSSDGNSLDVAAASGVRIAWASVPCGDKFNFIIPKTAIKNILSLGDCGDVSICEAESKAVFKIGEYTIYTSILYGEFLDYKPIFKTAKDSIMLEAEKLSDILQRALICSDGHPVRLIFSSEKLTVELQAASADFSEHMKVESDIDFTIGMNPKLLLDGVKTFSGVIKIGLNSPTSPVTVEQGNQKALIMPVRLR